MKTLLFSFSIMVLLANITYGQLAVRAGVVYKATESGNTSTQKFAADIPTFWKFRTPGKYMEAGLSDFLVSSERYMHVKATAIQVSPFLENGWLIGSEEKKLKMKFGVRTTLGSEFTRMKPHDTFDFPSSSFTVAATLAAVPGINYRLNDRLLVDVGIPFQLLTLSSNFRKWENPTLPVRDQKYYGGVEGEFFPKVYQLRIGMVYLLRCN